MSGDAKIKFFCRCGQKIGVPAERAGLGAMCPTCSRMVRVPSSSQGPEQPAEELWAPFRPSREPSEGTRKLKPHELSPERPPPGESAHPSHPPSRGEPAVGTPSETLPPSESASPAPAPSPLSAASLSASPFGSLDVVASEGTGAGEVREAPPRRAPSPPDAKAKPKQKPRQQPEEEAEEDTIQLLADSDAVPAPAQGAAPSKTGDSDQAIPAIVLSDDEDAEVDADASADEGVVDLVGPNARETQEDTAADFVPDEEEEVEEEADGESGKEAGDGADEDEDLLGPAVAQKKDDGVATGELEDAEEDADAAEEEGEAGEEEAQGEEQGEEAGEEAGEEEEAAGGADDTPEPPVLPVAAGRSSRSPSSPGAKGVVNAPGRASGVRAVDGAGARSTESSVRRPAGIPQPPSQASPTPSSSGAARGRSSPSEVKRVSLLPPPAGSSDPKPAGAGMLKIGLAAVALVVGVAWFAHSRGSGSGGASGVPSPAPGPAPAVAGRPQPVPRTPPVAQPVGTATAPRTGPAGAGAPGEERYVEIRWNIDELSVLPELAPEGEVWLMARLQVKCLGYPEVPVGPSQFLFRTSGRDYPVETGPLASKVVPGGILQAGTVPNSCTAMGLLLFRVRPNATKGTLIYLPANAGKVSAKYVKE
ncbi:MAG: hypothetical protein HYZ53_21585 [Planctomycetes bacterium]|nr:hypothetical protein [Planctomycetota bacterium]